ncbi:MAG: non-canonical purine NTP pyrophosphatase [Planctomycetota bacterium]|nr:non-canonical purine NTP pyrophosphatase [Planctomycetota bacterium]
MQLLVATSNPHKLAELRGVLGPLGITALSLTDVPGGPFPEPVEDGLTFFDNARIKARAYARLAQRVALADDSGLEVDALGGAPGVHSATYAGPEGARAQRDARNNAKLLNALQGIPHDRRTARFVCVMCAAAPDGSILAESRGTFEGVIGTPPDVPRGTNGFGYDPLLILPEGNTSAELTEEQKNARSHRGAAARAIAPLLLQALRART